MAPRIPRHGVVIGSNAWQPLTNPGEGKGGDGIAQTISDVITNCGTTISGARTYLRLTQNLKTAAWS